jgi:hypothetical protein
LIIFYLSTRIKSRIHYEELKALSTEELKKKEKGSLTLVILFIPLIIGLFYSVFHDYSSGKELEMPILIIAICTLSGLFSVLPDLKAVREELKGR